MEERIIMKEKIIFIKNFIIRNLETEKHLD
jgi:hypothetical protein